MIDIASQFIDINNFQRAWEKVAQNRGGAGVEKIADWRDMGYVWVLHADVDKFFDNIDHYRLLKEIRLHLDDPGILCLIKSWISIGLLTSEGLNESFLRAG